MTFFLPVLLAEAVLWPCRRIVPLIFAVVFADTAQVIDLRFAASLQAAANATPALVVATGAASGRRDGRRRRQPGPAPAPGCR